MKALHPFIEFLEDHLGQMSEGRSYSNDDVLSGSVACFADQPCVGATTLVTLGLSKHKLHNAPRHAESVELLTCTWDRFGLSDLAHVLWVLAGDVLESHHAPSFRSVVGPAGPVVSGSTLEAFYFTAPSYFPQELEYFYKPGFETIALLWAIPITRAEAHFVRANGGSTFEDLIIETDADMMDLKRLSIVPASAT